MWWRDQAARWNGVSLLYEDEWEADAGKLTLYTDACQTGYGAVWGNQWIAGRWKPEEIEAARRVSSVSMPYMETRCLLYAAATWAPEWRGKRVLFMTDCQVSVDIIGDGKHNSKEADLQALVRRLSELACEHLFDYKVEHIAGELNVAADALSRGNFALFRSVCPSALPRPRQPRRDLVPMPPRMPERSR